MSSSVLPSQDVDTAAHTLGPTSSRPSWKRFQPLVSPHVPTLILDEDASLLHLTPAARALLEYRSEEQVDPYFFTHVHGRNLRRVMRDIADMVKYGKSKASWLVQMRTGQGRWRWFKATVHNRLQRSESVIIVKLSDLYDW